METRATYVELEAPKQVNSLMGCGYTEIDGQWRNWTL